MKAFFSGDALIFNVLFLVRPFMDSGAMLRNVSLFFWRIIK